MHARYIPLFWRLFIPNATVLAAAGLVLHLEPANGRIPAIGGGVAMMLVVNLVLMRRAVTPLERLTDLMRRVDPLRPGERIPAPRAESEVSVLSETFNEMLDRLEAERRESLHRALSEREAERRRVADELHDQIGQNLTALALQLDRLHKRSPDDLRDEVVDARDGVLATVEDVRGVVRTLRPEGLDALGLPAALTSLTSRLTQRTGIQIVRELQRDLPALDDGQELVLYRVAQESVTNAIRHAERELHRGRPARRRRAGRADGARRRRRHRRAPRRDRGGRHPRHARARAVDRRATRRAAPLPTVRAPRCAS